LLTNKQVKLLTLLDKQIQSCTECGLYENGRCKPYWTENSEYVMVLEAPGRDEIPQNTPVVGNAGKQLWIIADHLSLPREKFLIINTVNCRPLIPNTNKNGKPTQQQALACRKWVRKYIKVLSPKKGIVMGSYSLFTIFEQDGIMSRNSTVEFSKEFGIEFVKSIHPAMCIYNGERGKSMLLRSLEVFEEVKDGKDMAKKESPDNGNRHPFF